MSIGGVSIVAVSGEDFCEKRLDIIKQRGVIFCQNQDARGVRCKDVDNTVFYF